MNRKMRKIRNRLVQTIQANYSVSDSIQKKRNSSSQNHFQTKLSDKISDKISSINRNSLKINSKRVYLTNIQQTIKTQNYDESREEKEELLKLKNSETQQRYILRTKSSNGLSQNRSLRMSSKNNTITKNNHLQLESQFFCNVNNSYLVTGVKNQYEKMKKSYDQKCIEIQNIKKQYKVNTVKQLKIYIQKLQKQNIKILNALQKNRIKNNKSPGRSSAAKILISSIQNDQNKNVVPQLSQKLQKIENKFMELNKNHKQLLKYNKTLLSKTFLYNKFIMQKQNAQFNARSDLKKAKKQIIQLKQKVQNMSVKFKSEQKNQQQIIQSIKANLRQEYCIEIKELKTNIKEKDIKVDKLEKQINHLKMLLQQWKHNQSRENSQCEKAHSTQRGQIQHSYYQTKISLQLDTDRFKKQNSKIKFKNSLENDLNPNIVRQYNDTTSQRSLNKSMFKNQAKKSEKDTQKSFRRERITAKTCKTDSVKSRPVELNQVQPTIQFLRLKLAFQKFNPQQIKFYFQFHKDKEIHVSLSVIQARQSTNLQVKKQHQQLQEQGRLLSWQQEYITLKEVYNVFIQEPFSLKQAQSLLLSRFIIQDVKQSYVYMNWDSENIRRVVLSIISNLVGSYSIISESTVQKAEQLLKRYENNILSALKSVSGKTGKVSLQKFNQILNGLGLERTKFMDQYIIGKMCAQSLSLQQLSFLSLYPTQ